MTSVCALENAKCVSIYAQVIKADGTVESNRLISFFHKNPTINTIVNFYIKLRDKLNGRKSPK